MLTPFSLMMAKKILPWMAALCSQNTVVFKVYSIMEKLGVDSSDTEEAADIHRWRSTLTKGCVCKQKNRALISRHCLPSKSKFIPLSSHCSRPNQTIQTLVPGVRISRDNLQSALTKSRGKEVREGLFL